MSATSTPDQASRRGRMVRRLGVASLMITLLAGLSLILPKVRALALEGYGRIGPPGARLWAVRRLGELGGAGAPGLARLFVDEDHPQILEESQELLIKLKDRADPALPILVARFRAELRSGDGAWASGGRVLGLLRRPAALPSLIALVTDGSREEKLGALALLAQYGEAASPAASAAQAALAGADIRLVNEACQVLAACGEPTPDLARAVIAAVRTTGADYYALLVLLRCFEQGPASRPVILQALSDESSPVRWVALSALDKAPREVAVSRYLAALRDPAVAVRARAFQGLLERRASEAIAPMIEAIALEEDASRSGGFHCLLGIAGRPALTVIARRRLTSERALDRIAGARLVVGLEPKEDAALQGLVRPLLRSKDSAERRAGMRAAQSLRDRHPETLEALIAALKRGRAPEERCAAAGALAELAPPRALPALTDMALDGRPPLIEAAARALAAMGGEAAPAIPALRAQLDRETPARRAVIRAIAAIDGERVLVEHALERMSPSAPTSVRRLNADLLTDLRSGALVEAGEALEAAFRDPDPVVRERVFAAIFQAGLADAAEGARARALADPAENVVWRAVQSLGWPDHSADPRVLSALLDALELREGELRQQIFTELWRREKNLAVILPKLRAALTKGPEDLKRNAAVLLRTMKEAAAPLRAELESLARSENEETRRAAAETLRGLRRASTLNARSKSR